MSNTRVLCGYGFTGILFIMICFTFCIAAMYIVQVCNADMTGVVHYNTGICTA